ncbi:hypothetical protein Rs2_11403 [Raphanus sativus]|nr:hypothetical protein Rs2_11403 [Raphanus sativus]
MLKANSLSVKTLPPLVTLDAGEASGHRRRVLCITSCSLLSSPEFIVVSISRASILVVSNFASLSDPIAASLAPPLVTAASPVLLLVTTHTLTASRKARSRRLIGSARCFVSTVTPLGVFLPPELAIRHPVSSPVGTLELLVCGSAQGPTRGIGLDTLESKRELNNWWSIKPGSVLTSGPQV